MSKPFKMRSGNSPMFKLMGASPVKQSTDIILTDDEQISDYLGETKQDIRKRKKEDLARSHRQQEYATGSRSGKKTNINLNPLSIIDPYGPLSGKGHFGITTSQVRKVTDPKQRRQWKKRLKKKHKEIRSNIKDQAKLDIQDRKKRENVVKNIINN
jgi:hypothetical protein